MRVKDLVVRLAFLVLVVWSAATVNFFLPRLSGKDPVRQRMLDQLASGSQPAVDIDEMVRIYDVKFGLDKPLWRQYLTYLGDMARFDLGTSIYFYPRDVKDIIGEALPWSIGLLTVSVLFSFTVGIILGAFIGSPGCPKWMQLLALPLISLAAMPYYLLGLIMLMVFAFRLNWLPGTGGYSIGAIPNSSWAFALDVLKHSVLPALSVVLSSIGFWTLGMRGMMVTVQGEEYMTLAEAKGLKERRVFLRYAVRNAILPQATELALSMGYVVSGFVLVERVFSFPGLGTTLFAAIKGVDFPVIQGVVLTLVFALAIALLILDLILPLLDPRIRVGRE